MQPSRADTLADAYLFRELLLENSQISFLATVGDGLRFRFAASFTAVACDLITESLSPPQPIHI